MKIESGAITAPSSKDDILKRAAAYLAATPPVKPQGSDSAYNVDISPEASHTASTGESDDISHDRVAAIRDQLAAGTYNISGKDVARKILGVLK